MNAMHKARILVVDDNRDAVESLQMLLQLIGHEVKVAYDGPQAVDAYKAERPDIVFLDIGLPRLNGYEVARKIRGQATGHTPMLVALTGWGQEEDQRLAEQAGFDHHIVKPVAYEQLTDLLQRATLSEN